MFDAAEYQADRVRFGDVTHALGRLQIVSLWCESVSISKKIITLHFRRSLL